MGIAVAISVGIAVLLVIAFVVFGALGLQASRARQAEDRHVETLRYPVPTGQDPSVVVAALRKAGYDAVTDLVDGSPVAVVPCMTGAERERARVRSVIGESSATSMEGPEFDPGRVRFDDENQN